MRWREGLRVGDSCCESEAVRVAVTRDSDNLNVTVLLGDCVFDMNGVGDSVSVNVLDMVTSFAGDAVGECTFVLVVEVVLLTAVDCDRVTSSVGVFVRSPVEDSVRLLVSTVVMVTVTERLGV